MSIGINIFPQGGSSGNGGVAQYAGVVNFPATGNSSFLYIDTTTNTAYYWNGSSYISLGSGTGSQFRGVYSASSNSFPTTGGSGTAGAIQSGDTWVITTAGTLGSYTYQIGDYISSKTSSPGQTEANWTRNSMFVNSNLAILDQNGSDTLAPRFPNKTIAGAVTTFPTPATYLINPSATFYTLPTNCNNLSVKGVDAERSIITTNPNAIVITNGNIFTKFEDLEIQKTTTGINSVKLSGNIGNVILRRCFFSTSSGTTPDITLTGVTGGTITIDKCKFSDITSLQITVDSTTTNCNINVILCSGTAIKYNIAGKAQFYVEDCTVSGTSTSTASGAVNIEYSSIDVAGITCSMPAATGNSLVLIQNEAFVEGTGYSPINIANCLSIFADNAINFNNVTFTSFSQLNIANDTTKSRTVNSTTVTTDSLTPADGTVKYDCTKASVTITLFDTNTYNTNNTMTIRTITLIKLDSSSNPLVLNLSGAIDAFTNSSTTVNSYSFTDQDSFTIEIDFINHLITIL